MANSVSFIDLAPDTQDFILGKAARYLNYTEITYLVGSFNIHNRSSSPCKITSPAMLNTLKFIHNGVLHLTDESEYRASYLKDRFVEVVQTKDIQVSCGLISDDFIVKCLQTFSPTQFNQAISNAAGRGHFEAVYLFLTFNRPMRVDLRGLLVSHAAGNGHAKIVRKLLENRAAIGNDMRGNALGAAARCGCLEAVELLDSADVWEDPRGSAVMNAAEGGHIAIVKFLLRNGNIVPENRENGTTTCIDKWPP